MRKASNAIRVATIATREVSFREPQAFQQSASERDGRVRLRCSVRERCLPIQLPRIQSIPGSNQSHSSDAIWRKHPVAGVSTGGWNQEIPPLVETNSVRTYAGKTSQLAAIQGSSFRNFRTHRISLKLGISSKVKQIVTLSHIGAKRLIKPR